MMPANSVWGRGQLLKIISRFSQLDFSQLMSVHELSCVQDANRNLDYLQLRDDFYHYLRESFFREADCVYAVWALMDRYVSALRLEPYKDGLLIEALETAPNEQGKGYATALLLAVTDYLHSTKWNTIYAHVDKRNAASLSVHRKCGFKRVLEYAAFVDGSVSHRSCTLRLNIKKEGTD